MIDAAIVGLGRWGRTLVEAVQGKSDKIRFTRAVSRDPAQHRDFLETQHLLAGSSLAEVLADRSIKAVVLATPHTRHVDEVVAVAAAGKAVFCEKPLALTKEGAARAVAACRDAGVVLGIGTDKRYFPAIAEVIRLADSGELGKLLHVEGNFSNEVAAGFAAWRGVVRGDAGGRDDRHRHPCARRADPHRRAGAADARAAPVAKARPRPVRQPVGDARVRLRGRRHPGGGALDPDIPARPCVRAQRLGRGGEPQRRHHPQERRRADPAQVAGRRTRCGSTSKHFADAVAGVAPLPGVAGTDPHCHQRLCRDRR